MVRVISYRQAIATAMRDALERNAKAIVYGLGVTDHTGIFGTTLGLCDTFGPERVFDTPIAEDSMTGFAVGAALNGLYPIHVHIRNDFMLLAMNQLVNSAAKYSYMYGGCFSVPILIRGIIGRSWGQGAQHSQSLQALFAHIPGLTVIMPGSAQAVLNDYSYAVRHYKSPVISLEHRLLYDYQFELDTENENPNPFTSHLIRKGKDITVVATSIMVQDALRAAQFAKEREGIEVEVIDLNCLTHPDEKMILKSVAKTGKLIVADTGWASFGVCAEVSRIVAAHAPQNLRAPVINISMAKSTCPTAKALENHFYPDMGTVVDAVYVQCFAGKGHGRDLPSEAYKKKFYKEFKGPF